MGIISKQIHLRTTRQLTEPIRLNSSLDAPGVFAIAAQVVTSYVPVTTGFFSGLADMNYAYWLLGKGDKERQVVCGTPVAGSSAATPRPQWVARLSVAEEDNNCSAVTFGLVKWLTKDGALVRRRAFEEFRDRLLAALREQDRILSPNAEV